MTATHVHEPVIRPSNELIAAKAREVHPAQFTGRMLLTTITFVFMSLGWIAGTSWYLTVFSFLWTASHLKWLGLCVRYGFVKGARQTLVPKE
jgi:hypothetical protein